MPVAPVASTVAFAAPASAAFLLSAGRYRTGSVYTLRAMSTSSAAQTSVRATDAPVTSAPSVQYVVVRKDLRTPPPAGLGWPAGSVIAQAVHASVAAVWKTKCAEVTSSYCGEDGGRQMHTVVLEAKNEEALVKLAGTLDSAEIQHVVWREQPENFVTAIAAAPYPRDVVMDFFKKFKLMK
jgi:peptidyl-tRNA hydrolase